MNTRKITMRFRQWSVSTLDGLPPQTAKICFLALVLLETNYIYIRGKDLLHQPWPVLNSVSVSWLNFISYESQANFAMITAWIALLTSAFLVAFIFHAWARVIFFGLLAIICTLDMFKTQGHAVHYFFWSFVPFAFVPNISQAWQWSLRFSQYLILSTYFFSGMNKLFSLPGSFHTTDQAPFFFSMPYLIAHEYIITNKRNNVLDIFATHKWLGATSLSVAILLQISVIVVLVKPRYIPLYGVCFSFFHIANYLILGPDFLKVIPIVLSITVLPWIVERMKSTSIA